MKSSYDKIRTQYTRRKLQLLFMAFFPRAIEILIRKIPSQKNHVEQLWSVIFVAITMWYFNYLFERVRKHNIISIIDKKVVNFERNFWSRCAISILMNWKWRERDIKNAIEAKY